MEFGWETFRERGRWKIAVPTLLLVLASVAAVVYFDRDEEHAAALHGMVDTVRPGGWFVLDFLHAPEVRRALVGEEAATLAGAAVRLHRRLEDGGRVVVKDIALGDGRRFRERVRLFEPAELEEMVVAAGARVSRRFGDYDGGPLRATSPRVLLLAERA